MIGPRHRSDTENPLPAAATPVASRQRKKQEKPVSFGRGLLNALTEVVVVLGMALCLSLVIKTFLVQAFFIPSESMENSLLVGDRVVVSKLTPGPLDLKRGDVVVFKDPGGWLPSDDPTAESPSALHKTLTFVGLLPSDSGQHLIKRVIGLPGDTVACCDAKGRLTVNGVAIDEPYIFPGDDPSEKGKPWTYTVPAGKLWVMGDHRSVSFDSRLHPGNNFVPIDDVVGKAFVVVWPLNRLGGVASAGTTFDQVPKPPS